MVGRYPFTANDFMYYYDHVLTNKELTPIVAEWALVGGQLIKFVKVDGYTIRWDFPTSYPSIVGQTNASVGQQPGTLWWWGSYQAEHYAKQFHPHFIGMAKAVEMAKAAGFDTWTQLYWNKTDTVFGVPINAGGEPVLTAYVCVGKTMEGWVFERNPFYWAVDTQGNQLPYIDRVVSHVTNSPDVVQGKLMTGEVDFFAGSMADMALYTANAEKGGYKVRVWKSGEGSAAHLQLNLTIEGPVLRQLFGDVRFRRALSHAIDRDEINKKVYFGLATPRAHTVPPYSEYFRPEFGTAYTKYDVAAANRLLDEGLVDGLLLVNMHLNQQEHESIRERMPLVLVAAQAEFADYVMVDNHGGIVSGVEYIHTLGHRNVAFVNNEKEIYETTIRESAFRSTADTLGIRYFVDYRAVDRRAGYLAAKTLVASHPELTCLFYYSDLMAYGGVDFVNAHRLQDRVSVIGFDGFEMTYHMDLATIAQPMEEMGNTGAQVLLRMIRDNHTRRERIVPDTTLVKGKTCKAVVP